MAVNILGLSVQISMFNVDGQASKLARRENMIATGAAVVSTATTCSALRLLRRGTLIAAGAGAGGTGALCTFLQK